MNQKIALQLALLQEKEERKQDRIKIMNVQRSLRNVLTDINNLSVEEEYSGWFILLKENKNDPSGVEFVGIFNPFISDDSEEPEWEYCICIPLKKLAKFPEFTGW